MEHYERVLSPRERVKSPGEQIRELVSQHQLQEMKSLLDSAQDAKPFLELYPKLECKATRIM